MRKLAVVDTEVLTALEGLARDWLASAREGGKSPRTLDAYRWPGLQPAPASLQAGGARERHGHRPALPGPPERGPAGLGPVASLGPLVPTPDQRVPALVRAGGGELEGDRAAPEGAQEAAPDPDPGVWPHVFRHSYCTHLLQQNVSPAKVMQLLGHSTMEMVMEVYNQLRPADAMDDVIRALGVD